MPHFAAWLMTILDWDGLRDHLRDVPWEDIIEITFFICTHRINLLNLKKSSDRLLFSCCKNPQNKSSKSKEKFRQASNRCESVPEAAKLAYATKQKSPSPPRNLALGTFGKLLIVFSTKVNLLYRLYSTDRRCCLLHLIKQNYLLKTFLRTLILMTLVSLYLFSLLELI